jgi:uncharacterized membrane protein YphA (DoxX/SURF4 family)
MTKVLQNKYLLISVQFFLGLIFIIAGAQKIIDPSGFAESIMNYRIFPLFSINYIAITLPWIELISGILLIFGKYVKENALIYSVLMSAFIILVMSAIFRGLDFECGCFGTNDATRVGWIKILENIGLLTLSVYVYLFGEK